jgi:hypothetical protein
MMSRTLAAPARRARTLAGLADLAGGRA